MLLSGKSAIPCTGIYVQESGRTKEIPGEREGGTRRGNVGVLCLVRIAWHALKWLPSLAHPYIRLREAFRHKFFCFFVRNPRDLDEKEPGTTGGKPVESRQIFAKSIADRPACHSGQNLVLFDQAPPFTQEQCMYLRPEDKVLILEANARYNHAFDVQDVVEWLDTWTDYANLVTPDGKIEGKEAMRAWFAGQTHEGLRHFSYNICSDGDTETAVATCDFLVLEIRDVPRIIATGSYTDNLTRIGDRWKFATRKLTIDPVWKGMLIPA